jgi:hypothetical protein
LDEALAELDVTAEEHDANEAKARRRWRNAVRDLAGKPVTRTDEVEVEVDENGDGAPSSAGPPSAKKRKGPM